MTYMIRPFSPDDYPEIIKVHNAAAPEYPLSVEEMRFDDEHRDPMCKAQRWIAEQDGRVVAACEYYQNVSRYHPRKFTIEGVVHPDHQRQGIGSALYDQIITALRLFDPLSLLCVAQEDKTGSITFLKTRGFQESRRERVSRLDLAAFDPAPYAGLEEKLRSQGIEIKTFKELEDDPQRNRKLYELRWEIQQDVPALTGPPTQISYERFLESYLSGPSFIPDGYFIAIHDGHYLGLSNFWGTYGDRIIRTGLTGVRRSYRRKGIALALKLRSIACAKEQGYSTIETDNASTNKPMLAINERLGFIQQPAWIVFIKTFAATSTP